MYRIDGFKKAIAILSSGLSLLLITSCTLGGPSKPLHYYSLDNGASSSEEHTITNSNDDAGILVRPFQAPEIYRDPSIVWRNQRHLQRFRFNRWSSAPPALMQSFVTDLLRSNAEDPIGWISTPGPSKPDARYSLNGTVRDLYLEKSNDGRTWKAVVNVRLRLFSSRPPDAETTSSLTNTDRRKFLGSWTLHATATANAPPGEAETPEAMNRLLDLLSENLRKNGQDLVNSIRNTIQDDLKQQKQRNATSD